MKNKILNILLFAIAALYFSSCTDRDYMEYDVSQKDAVYMDFSEETDSLFYNFGFYEITEKVIKVPVKLMGMPRDYDREIKISVTNERYADETASAAIEEYFSVPDMVVLKKDSTTTHIPVTLLRHADLENLRAILTLNIEKTDDLDIRGHSEYTITFDDKTPEMPAWWTSYDMGEFSKLKGQLFFKYFWELEQEQKAIYDAIVERWGKFLDVEPNIYGDSPLVVYWVTFNKYVKLKLYNYSQEHPELDLNIQKPTI